ncbi:TPA: hypothetical protein R4C64_001755 [Salmonella enterica subsp. enterica serovar Saintpaul]|jgi:hypothetical protein|uniref:hypothetical protein n=2 Tax=Enterobacterales TaxID=91347 RepID=UPI000DE5FE95|nr:MULTISPECIES: hypothetical protein [Enterobacteriaceae]EAO6747627.1 hypothetical protein [Salmonella enterica]EBS5434243.1 hypothetical protein [Salmonella enterica subsp. enterica serovar Binza]EDQ2670548.1 hypothetical protein [Salmonella enterica subsp. enterica serovar Saintpaul]EIV5419378.1 hypothetical protein [Klebsiella aerogenes]HAN1837161.1 hypothetical protein [Escherichia coli]HAV1803894.1 hypothetical protein [Enterobacter hormaechei subsp. steigerwaltii]HBR1994548.1 hypothet
MSAKDAFFQKLETNANAQKEGEEAFKRDVLAFQEDTKALIQEIIGWFAGSPVTASGNTTQVTEDTDRFEVSNLTLKNGGKTLKITPEGLYYFGVKGSLEVSIHNPNRAPGTSKFNLHWKDGISKLSGWVIVSAGVGNAPAHRIEFNQENFFKMITAFA